MKRFLPLLMLTGFLFGQDTTLVLKNGKIIYDFSSKNKLKGWNIVDDNVMGGWSRGSLRLDSKGNGVFSG